MKYITKNIMKENIIKENIIKTYNKIILKSKRKHKYD